MINNLSKIQLDVLSEIGNIGAGNAATSIAKLMDKKIEMNPPSVNIVTFDDMMDIVGGPEQVIVTMLFRIHGDAPGTVYFILTIDQAKALMNQITPETELNLFDDEASNDLGISALKEIGNMMTGSYLMALSDFININMQSSIPYLSVDMAGAVLTTGLLETSQSSDYVIVIDTVIRDSDRNESGLQGHFFLLPDLKSLPKIFKALGIHDYE